ncbi:hypothetical protein SCP_0501040 [Sparassis crispa]|uniref:Uncharacterized protein n=1 Tax=Sparassis crispa TaxID=139825 RepID=A0A401GLQ0_9APHY|nr:hypothetical protein SCP_0501040 [Sparassis crispa]GBE83059.1 hypothetical protein SCP_0501040 [Sparassis crispa]
MGARQMTSTRPQNAYPRAASVLSSSSPTSDRLPLPFLPAQARPLAGSRPCPSFPPSAPLTRAHPRSSQRAERRGTVPHTRTLRFLHTGPQGPQICFDLDNARCMLTWQQFTLLVLRAPRPRLTSPTQTRSARDRMPRNIEDAHALRPAGLQITNVTHHSRAQHTKETGWVTAGDAERYYGTPIPLPAARLPRPTPQSHPRDPDASTSLDVRSLSSTVQRSSRGTSSWHPVEGSSMQTPEDRESAPAPAISSSHRAYFTTDNLRPCAPRVPRRPAPTQAISTQNGVSAFSLRLPLPFKLPASYKPAYVYPTKEAGWSRQALQRSYELVPVMANETSQIDFNAAYDILPEHPGFGCSALPYAHEVAVPVISADTSQWRRAVDDASSPPPLGPHILRTETVAALYEALNRYHFIRAYSFFIMRAVDSKGTQVRGTLASGKTTLAALLFGHIRAEEPNTVVCWIGSWPESIRYEYNRYRGWLLQRRGFVEDGVVIIGEVQNTYWYSGFWNSILKEIGPSSWMRVILFASYGDPRYPDARTNVLASPPVRRVTLQRAKVAFSRWGLFLTPGEYEDFANTLCARSRVDEDFIKAVFDVTAGHVGALADMFTTARASRQSYRDLGSSGRLFTTSIAGEFQRTRASRLAETSLQQG